MRHAAHPHIWQSHDELLIVCDICHKRMVWQNGIHIALWKRLLADFRKRHKGCKMEREGLEPS